jgi:nucleotide-binding universal stress UspA family protein
MNHILVPLLGTLDTEDALNVARGFAAHAGAHIDLLHVLDIDPPTHEPWSVRRSAAEAYLEATARTFPEDAAVDTHVLSGSPVSRIIEFARSSGATMIIVGPRWSDDPEQFAPDSVTQKLMESAEIPILLVPEGLNATPDPIGTVLLAFDGANSRNQRVLSVVDWIAPVHPLIRLVSIIGSDGHGASIRRSGKNGTIIDHGLDAVHRARSGLFEMRRILARQGIRSTWEVRHGAPVHELLRAADTTETDLIIMCPTSVRFDVESRFGHIALGVARLSRVPVLVFPTDASTGAPARAAVDRADTIGSF